MTKEAVAGFSARRSRDHLRAKFVLQGYTGDALQALGSSLCSKANLPKRPGSAKSSLTVLDCPVGNWTTT